MLKPKQLIRFAKAIPPFGGFFFFFKFLIIFADKHRYVQTAMSRYDDVSNENCF